MDKAAVLTHILSSSVKSTLLGGEAPVSVINSSRYIPTVSAEGQNISSPSLDEAIRAARSGCIRSVVLIGPEGSGKSTALQNVVVDWAKGKHFQNFSHVFHFQFRKINSLEGEISLETLIQHNHHQIHPESMALVLERPADVLFVFDGLDEYKHSLEPSVQTLCSDQNQAVSVSCLVASLLHGSLLSGAAFLVATRPTGNVKFLSSTQVKALGFLKPQREAFFTSFFIDPSEANRALLHMERTLGFYDFCTSPRFSWTVCSFYRLLIDSGEKLPETLSQLFAGILVHLIQQNTVSEACNRELVLALGRMASHCFIHQHSSCTKELIESFGFQQFLTSVGLFLRVEGEPESETSVFSFTSQLMQEFVLAVAFYLDRSKYEGVKKMLDRHKNGPKFLDFFLSGLSEAGQSRSLEVLVGSFDPDQIKDFKSWFKSSSEETLLTYYRDEHYPCFHLLHQTQNESLVKEILAPHVHRCTYLTDLSLQDSVALNYVLTCLGQRETLRLGSATILKETMEALSPAMRLTRTVILAISSWQTEAVSLLASAVSAGVPQELNLDSSRLGDEKLKILFAGLRVNKLQRLNLGACGLTAACCDDLATLLTLQTSQLQVLELMYNQIEDQGFSILCKAMHSPHCRIQELQLQRCDLTAASMEDFAAALCSGRSQLRKVDLSDDSIGDRGAEALCKALQHPLCQLQSLILFDCGLTDACCSHLKDVLMSEHCSLSELDLALNDLGQEGALLLCQGLRQPGCSIERLSLTRCELTPTVFEELGSLLTNGTCRIKSLLLSLNEVGDAGVKHIWDAVSHPSCILENLDVEITGLTDACTEDLCAAVRASKTLKVLELKNNSLTDASVPAIVQVMRDKHNMEINLKYNEFSEDVFEMMEECGNIRY